MEGTQGGVAVGLNALVDNAGAIIAIGDTQVIGIVYQKSSELISQNVTVMTLTKQDIATVKDLFDTIVSTYLSWAKEIIKRAL